MSLNQSVSRTKMQMIANTRLLADAGRMLDTHAMVWLRELNTPIEQVWEAVSTLDGLKKWWVVEPVEFELVRGGTFSHYWNNDVVDFEPLSFIDFEESAGSYKNTGGMRIELKALDENRTLFMFLDSWGPDMVAHGGEGDAIDQPGGPGTPWPGVAAGWHAMIDSLEELLDGRKPDQSYDELIQFYVGYLRDMYRWHSAVQRQMR